MAQEPKRAPHLLSHQEDRLWEWVERYVRPRGDRRKHGWMLEQSYNLIVPTKVGNRRAPETGGHGTHWREGGSKRSAAMLAAILAGVSPARGTCPVATVAISGDETGDQFIGSPDVKVPVGRAAMLGQIRQGANNSTGRNASEPWSSSEISPPTGSGLWEILEVPSRLRFGEGQRRAKWRSSPARAKRTSSPRTGSHTAAKERRRIPCASPELVQHDVRLGCSE
jgi:hypothetical protein